MTSFVIVNLHYTESSISDRNLYARHDLGKFHCSTSSRLRRLHGHACLSDLVTLVTLVSLESFTAKHIAESCMSAINCDSLVCALISYK